MTIQQQIQQLFGKINPPPGTPAGIDNPINILVQVLNIALTLIMIISSLFALVNFITAGFNYLQAGGDAKKIQSANDKIKWSAVGLLIVVISPVIAALVGYIAFGNPMAILKPTIQTIQ